MPSEDLCGYFHSWRLSGRDGQRLAGAGGVVNFVGCLIIVRLMNPSLIVKVNVTSQPGLQCAPVLLGPRLMSSYFTLRHSRSMNRLSIQRPLPSVLMRTPAASSTSVHALLPQLDQNWECEAIALWYRRRFRISRQGHTKVSSTRRPGDAHAQRSGAQSVLMGNSSYARSDFRKEDCIY